MNCWTLPFLLASLPEGALRFPPGGKGKLSRSWCHVRQLRAATEPGEKSCQTGAAEGPAGLEGLPRSAVRSAVSSGAARGRCSGGCWRLGAAGLRLRPLLAQVSLSPSLAPAGSAALGSHAARLLPSSPLSPSTQCRKHETRMENHSQQARNPWLRIILLLLSPEFYRFMSLLV